MNWLSLSSQSLHIHSVFFKGFLIALDGSFVGEVTDSIGGPRKFTDELIKKMSLTFARLAGKSFFPSAASECYLPSS